MAQDNGGPPEFVRGPVRRVQVDLPADVARTLDAWIASQPERSEAIVLAIRDWLSGIGPARLQGASGEHALKAAVAAAAMLIVASARIHADEVLRHRGRCQSLTILDRQDAVRCADEMLVQTSGGRRSFVFRTDNVVVVFVTIDQKADTAGRRDFPLNQIEFGTGGHVETMPVLRGTCRSVDPASTWRAETACEADTTKGHLAAKFVTIDDVAEPIAPSVSSDTIR